MDSSTEFSSDKINLDEIDRRILRALVSDGRLSNTDLAKQVGLSPSPCWQRVRRLERDGIITGYTARLNHDALGVGETVLIEVSFDKHDAAILDDFGRAMLDAPEVLEVHLMSGDYDFFVKIAARGTRDAERFIRERMYRMPGLRQSKSSFSLRCLKRVSSYVPD